MNIDINYPLGKKLYNQLKENNRAGHKRSFNELVDIFSQINSQEDLDFFCQKYKINTEDLQHKYIPYNFNLIEGSSDTEKYNEPNEFISFIYLSFISKNKYMVNHFSKLYDNIYKDAPFEKKQNNSSSEVTYNFFDAFLSASAVPLSSLNIKTTFTFDNFMNSIEDDKLDQSDITSRIFLAYFENQYIADDSKLRFFELYTQNIIPQNDDIDSFVNKNISFYLHERKLGFLLFDFYKPDIINDADLISKIHLNPNIFNKALEQYDFDFLSERYELLKESYSNHPNDKSLIRHIATSYKDDFSMLLHLDKQGSLEKIIKNDDQFLNTFFYYAVQSFYIPESEQKESMNMVFDMLKTKYNYEYYGSAESSNTMFFAPGKKAKESLILHHIFENNLNNMPDKNFQHFLKDFINTDKFNYIDIMFNNPNKKISNNELYLSVLEIFGADKRIKFFNSEAGLNQLNILLSNYFKDKHNISTTYEQMSEALKNKTEQQNELGSFISRFLILESMGSDHTHKKTIKNRL